MGKSSLFNRLVGERRAIIEDVPGTTRDRMYGDADFNDRIVTVVDTGGLEAVPASTIKMAEEIREQVQAAIAEADVVVFVVDAREGPVAADLEVAEILRRSSKPVVLAANKADSLSREQASVEFYQLGLGDPVPVSAVHGTGTDDVVDEVRRRLGRPLTLVDDDAEEEQRLGIAIVGRPNVGKSALLNAILGEQRVIVSPIPGTTRDAIDTQFRYGDTDITLIDTAGMRRRGRVEAGIEYYSVLRAVRAMQRADVAVLVLDASQGVTAQDTHVAGYIQEEHKGIVIVVNKWDLISPKDPDAFTRHVRHEIKFFPHAPVLFTSALQKRGVDRVLKAAVKVYDEERKRIPTTALNQAVKDALASHSPPSHKGKPLKFYYATQVATSPPTFVFFVNDRELLHFSYQRFLENRLREAFGFEGASIRLIFRDHEDQDRREGKEQRSAR